MNDEGRISGGPARGRARHGRGHGRRFYRRPFDARPPGGGSRPHYAALDLGTNNCRLLVARPTYHGFRVVDAFSRIVRLGEGVLASHRISDAAITRTLSALAVCRDKMHHRGVTRARLIATEACRSAANCDEFLARVNEEIGLDLEVVDRETEATLAATGCTPLIDPQSDGVILFDIGGGSSELVRLDRSGPTERGPPHPTIRGWISLPLGVVTLAERHGGVNISPEVFEAMIAEVGAQIAEFAAAHRGGLASMHMLGTSGTVTTIAGVHLDLPRYERRRVDGCWLSNAQISSVVERLLAMSYEERKANPCIGAARADLVLAGCAILEAIRRAFPCERLRVADRGLREGMLVQMMREDGVWDRAATAGAPA
jgi:exopolyphosphatase / guanosine-5'-triphosphate,3'-diphosphate pyrophosphatase